MPTLNICTSTYLNPCLGALLHPRPCPKTTPKLPGPTGAGTFWLQEPLSCCWECSGSQDTGKWLFFPPNKSTTPSWLMETWPWSKFVFTAWGQSSASPTVAPCSSNLPNLQSLGNFSQGLLGVTTASRGKLWLLFLKCGFVAWGYFYPP